jgi:hypothetical protein
LGVSLKISSKTLDVWGGWWYSIFTMKTYKVPVVYTMYGYVEIEAESPEEAVKEVENGGGDIPLPSVADYVEGSFEVDHDGLVEEVN